MEFNKYKERGAYHWDLYGKDHIYTSHVDKVIKWVRKGSTLDIGAGDGLITYLLGAEGIDDNEIAVRLAQEKGANVNLGSAYDRQDKRYNNVLMLDVLEHLERPEEALSQVRANLLYIVTPPAKDKLHDKYHYQEWTKRGLIGFMANNGFKCENIEVVNEYVRMYATFYR